VKAGAPVKVPALVPSLEVTTMVQQQQQQQQQQRTPFFFACVRLR
jgi:hypothetical protein